jgi:hypothetical protein
MPLFKRKDSLCSIDSDQVKRLTDIENERRKTLTEIRRKESQALIEEFLTSNDFNRSESSDDSCDSSDSNKRRETLRQTLQSFQSSQLRGRRSELEEEKINAKKSLRTSLAGCEINERLVNKFGSVKAILSENERMEKTGLFVIHPYSNFRFAWDMFTLVMLGINVICIPVCMAFPIFEFDTNKPINDQTEAYAAMIFRLVSDAWFTVDIALNFRTGIVEDNEILIDARAIRKKYLRGWFPLDLISTFPFDIAVTAYTKTYLDSNGQNEPNFSQSTSFLRYLRLTKLFQLLRLLRVSRISRYMQQWDEMFNLPYDSAIIYMRMIAAFLWLLLYAHVSACIQFMVPMVLQFPENCWVRIRGLHKDTSAGVQYGWSFFRAVSQMLCIGYGQFPPQCMQDMYVTTILMLLGAISFAVFIGWATSLVQSHNASKRLYSEKYSSVKHYMIFRKLPLDLRKRISDYYENRYQGKMFNETQILRELNPVLRESIINHNCRDLVDAVPFFQKADPEFVSALVTLLKFEVYLYNDEIIREGTIGRKMYFISRGTVRIVSAKSAGLILSDGSFFGEISLILPNLRRVASVYADSYCYLYSLTVEDFNKVLDDFPMQRKHFYAEAGKRLENMKAESQKDDSDQLPNRDNSKTSINRGLYKRRKTINNKNRL